MTWSAEQGLERGRQFAVVVAAMVAAVGCNTMGVGSTPGALDVSPSGAATYTVPLRLPPGVGDATPSLSLSYSSHAGDGLMGMGWRLVGLSTITRCPRTMPIDGEIRGIDFSANDEYCLDGERLISIGNGEYRTHTEQFAKIESFGSAGTGPAWFRVTTRNGVQHEYGNTNKSLIEAQPTAMLGGSARVYAINKVTDRSGNYYTVEYEEDATSGDFWPTEMNYTAHATQAAKHRIEFEYQTRNNADGATVKRYIGRAHVWSTRLLETVRVSTDGAIGYDTLVEYELGYGPLSERGHSRLASIQECVPDTIQAMGGTVCKPATTFQWADGEGGLGSVIDPETGQPWANADDYMDDLFQQDLNDFDRYPGDYNGDGITDLFLVGTGEILSCDGKGMTTNPSYQCASFDWNGEDHWRTQFAFYPGDYNGDGRTDLFLADKRTVFPPGETRTHWLCDDQLHGPATPICTQLATSWADDEPLYTGDYDGDGRTDVVRRDQTGGVHFCPASTLMDPANCWLWDTKPGWVLAYDLYPGDYDGDGRSDLIAISDDSLVWCSGGALSGPAGSPCESYPMLNWRTDYDIHPGDFNADGQEDLLLVGGQKVFFCAGPGIIDGNNCLEVSDQDQDWRNNYKFFTGDFDGNAATDITLLGPAGVDFCQGPYISQVNGLGYCNRVINQENMDNPAFGIIPGDFDGDGVPDFLVLEPSLPSCSNPGFTTGFALGFPDGVSSYSGTIFVNRVSEFPDQSNLCYYTATVPADTFTVPTIALTTGWHSTTACIPQPQHCSHNPSQQQYFDSGNVNYTRSWPSTQFGNRNWTWGANVFSFSGVYVDGRCTSRECRWVGNIGNVTMGVGGDSILRTLPGDPTFTRVKLARGRSGPIDVIDSIHVGVQRDGSGNDYQIEYNPLTNTHDSLYTKGSGAAYPERDVQGATWVVRKLTMPDGLATPGTYDVFYSYEGLRADTEGRQSLGFMAVNTRDARNDMLVRREFSQELRLAGRVTREAVYEFTAATGWGPLFSETTSTWELLDSDACTQCKHPVATQRIERAFELGTPATPTTTTTSTSPLANFDQFGNPQLVVTTVDNEVTGTAAEYERTVVTAFVNDETLWVLGLPSVVIQTATGPDGSTPSRTTGFSYDGQKRLSQTMAFAGSQTAQTTTTIEQRHARGMVERTRTSVIAPPGNASSSPDRVSIVRYDDYGRPHELENELNHVSYVEYNAWGQPTRTQDPNGVVATTVYDGFNQLNTESLSNGGSAYTAYADCTGGVCPFSEARLQKTLFPESSARVTVYYDALGREVGQKTHDFQLRTILTHTTYDSLGRVTRQARPRFDYEAPQETVTSYDRFDRPRMITPPGQPPTELCYPPLSVRYVGPDPGDGQRNAIRNFDAAGNLTSVSSNHNEVTCTTFDGGSEEHVTTYLYDGFGNPKEIQYNGGHKVVYEYDAAGRVTSMTDPSLGTWTSIHNGFGDFVQSESVGSGRRTQQTYDALGRPKMRTDSMPGQSETWTWAYDPANGKGKVGTVTKTAASDGSTYIRNYTYNSKSRVNTTSVTAAPASSWGVNPQTAWQLFGYDRFGRLTSKAGGLDEKYEYAADGTLFAIKATFEGSVFTMWEALNRDAQRRPVEVGFGNGLSTTRTYDAVTDNLSSIFTSGDIQNISYDFDALGNLRERGDARNGIVETFGYDRVDRMTWSKINNEATLFNSYDVFGNPTCMRSTDSNPANCLATQGLELVYGTAARPHSVTLARQSVPGAINVNGNSGLFLATYAYDADGNQIRRQHNITTERDVDYNAFNKPEEIRLNDAVATRYGYGPGREFLWRKHESGSNAGTVFAPLPGYEVHTVGGTAEHRTTVSAPDGAKIVFKTTTPTLPRQASKLEYVHGDHLGSSAIVTDHQGNVLEEYAYDPFGRQRDPGTGALTAVEPGMAMSTRTTEKGFTGQRQVPDHGLYDYGARFYDPSIGRFLQPDPVLQAPDNMQNLNRYTYVLNNPLKYVDPTGNVAQKISRADALALGTAIYGAGTFGPGNLGWDNSFVPDAIPEISIRVQSGGACPFTSFNNCGSSYTVVITNRPRSAPTSPAVIQSTGEATLVGTTLNRQENIQDYITATMLGEGIQTGTISGREFLQGITNDDFLVDSTIDGARRDTIDRGLIELNAFGIVAEFALDHFSPSPKAAARTLINAPRGGGRNLSFYNPLNPGPLAESAANSFRSGTYRGDTLTSPTRFYRRFGGDAQPDGAYWTRDPGGGPLGAVIESALDQQNWSRNGRHVHNTAVGETSRVFPVGTRIFEGTAARQADLVGGGSQVFIPNR